MAKSKASRKGKKEWRKNISTAEQEAYLVKAGREERSGGALESRPSSDIFFLDKGKGDGREGTVPCLGFCVSLLNLRTLAEGAEQAQFRHLLSRQRKRQPTRGHSVRLRVLHFALELKDTGRWGRGAPAVWCFAF